MGLSGGRSANGTGVCLQQLKEQRMMLIWRMESRADKENRTEREVR
jgi:hypothetical protein